MLMKMFQRILFALTLILALLAGGWTVHSIWTENAAPVHAAVEIQLGKVRLVILPAYIRTVDQRRNGEFPELELAVSARDFRAAGPPGKLRPGMEDASSGVIYLTLREQENSIEPADRPGRLYVRFLEPRQWSHPGGLVMRRFEPGSPFAGEDLYMAPPEGRLFAARCMRPQQPPDGLPNTCIGEIRQQGLDVRLRFSPELLSEWEHITAGVRGLITFIVR